jgi:hypothetical protein
VLLIAPVLGMILPILQVQQQPPQLELPKLGLMSQAFYVIILLQRNYKKSVEGLRI